MRFLDRISLKHVYLISLSSVYVFYILGLYGLIRGNYGATFSPLQPDSTQYVCRGIQMANVDTQVANSLLAKLTNNFRNPSEVPLSCGAPSLLYESRVLLPFLISISTVFESLWALFIPTFAFAAASIIMWWKLTKSYVRSLSALLLAIAPWLSPHFGGHVFLVLTEGPLIFLMLSILILTNSRISNHVYFLLLLLTSCLGIVNRQSWPIFAIVLAFSVTTRFQVYKNVRILLVFITAFLYSFILNELLTNSISQSINPSKTPDAISGVFNGLAGDFVHVIQFVDLPGVLVLFIMGILLFKVHDFKVQITFLLLLLVSLYSQGAIYLYDNSFSQNWRYYLPNAFFAVFIYLRNTAAKNSSAITM